MTRSARSSNTAGWNLYWVSSNGLEDCFVVAKNSRSARKLEREMNGFENDEIEVYRACKISEKLATSHLKRNKTTWPWYAYNDLLKKLNAEFREIDSGEQILINNIVYQQGFRPRKIGTRFLTDFEKGKITPIGWEEDRYTDTQSTLLLMLGICVARCQEIEHYISQSFVLGVSSKEKSKYKTISEFAAGWKKNTFGQLIRTIEESYQLEENFKPALEHFLSCRNKLVHGITMTEEFDIHTSWGQSELLAFLTKFEYLSRAVRSAFRSCVYASIEIGNINLIKDEKDKIKLTKKQRSEAALFPHFFILRPD